MPEAWRTTDPAMRGILTTTTVVGGAADGERERDALKRAAVP
jgi:hypothetical protein